MEHFNLAPVLAFKTATVCKLWVHINVPPPVPPGDYGPAQDMPNEMPTPDGVPPEIDEPLPETSLPIREPGVNRPPQAVFKWAGDARQDAPVWLH
jgi:hypothetical protein